MGVGACFDPACHAVQHLDGYFKIDGFQRFRALEKMFLGNRGGMLIMVANHADSCCKPRICIRMHTHELGPLGTGETQLQRCTGFELQLKNGTR
ncbi:hypothetical protein D3C72_1992610 [compost metagenome]